MDSNLVKAIVETILCVAIAYVAYAYGKAVGMTELLKKLMEKEAELEEKENDERRN